MRIHNRRLRGAPMAVYTVHRGARYRATIRLGVFQSVASNQQVADRFTVVGFTEVTVTGAGVTA